MNLYKTETASEFAQLVRESGVRPAEIARRMKLSKPTISNYLSGKIPVPPSRLDSLKHIVAQIKGHGRYPDHPLETIAGMSDPELRRVSNKLAEIHRSDPQAFETVSQVIGMAHKKAQYPPPSPKTNSDLPSDIGDRAARAASGARKKSLNRPPQTLPE